MTENKQLMAQAREALKDKWGLGVGGYFISSLISLVSGSVPGMGPVLQVLIGGPLLVGSSLFSLSFARGTEASLPQLFVGFKEFTRALVAYLWMILFILLWTLLLIVPGVIAALAYSQTFFILAEDKAIDPRQAVKKSKAMMQGHKKKLFFLTLRFFGWLILSILSLGIGFLWSIPYMSVTMGKFYDEVSKKQA